MHPRVSVNSIGFMDKSLGEQAQCWRSLEPGRVSLLGHHIEQEGLEAAKRALGTGDYQLETVVHPFLPGQALNPEETSWKVPRESLNAEIDRAKALDASSIYMVTGGHGGMVWEQAAEVFSRAIAPCVQHARDVGVPLLIENAPLLYADIHIAHTLRDTLTLAEMANIGVCIDLPGCWAEAGLDKLIQAAIPNCHLVQVSDYVCGDRALPARAVPGDGDMPLERLFGWLLDAGYRGAFDLELLGPRIAEEGALEATRRAGAEVGRLLEGLGA